LDLRGTRKQRNRRRLHKEKFYDLFLSNLPFDEIKNKGTGRPCGIVGDRTGAYRDLVGRPEGKETTWET
jgi:hypothetical protein